MRDDPSTAPVGGFKLAHPGVLMYWRPRWTVTNCGTTQTSSLYEIDSWDLKVALENGENVIVIDARSSQASAAEHIPGACLFLTAP